MNLEFIIFFFLLVLALVNVGNMISKPWVFLSNHLLHFTDQELSQRGE